MFDEKYQRLGITDKERFARIVNQLLARTFLPVDEYDFSEGITKVNKDYLFVERNFEMFQEYFSYAGFSLERDTGYGVIYLTSSYEGNRVRFDKITTLIVYALRLIFEEEREKLNLSQNVITTTGELVHKLISLGAIKKKPSNTQLHDSLIALSRFMVIRKMDGAWEAAETRFIILPVILFIVSNEQISNMYKLIDRVDGEIDIDEPAEVGDEET